MPKVPKPVTDGPKRSAKSAGAQELRVRVLNKPKNQIQKIKEKSHKEKEVKKVVRREAKTKKVKVVLERTQETYSDFNLHEKWNNQPPQPELSQESLDKILREEYTLMSYVLHKEIYEENLQKKREAYKKAMEEKLAAEKQAMEEKLAAEKQATEEKLAAEKQAMEEKLEAEQKAKEAEQKALEEQMKAEPELNIVNNDNKEKKKRKRGPEPLPHSHFRDDCKMCDFIKKQQAFLDSLTSDEEDEEPAGSPN